MRDDAPARVGMTFFSSFLGMYVTQTLLHSAVALFFVDAAIEVWSIRSPRSRFRFRFAVLVLPLVLYPLFQLAFPERGGFYFRNDLALFDSARWLQLTLWDRLPVGLVLLGLVVGGTAILMIMQEVVPVLTDGHVGTAALAENPLPKSPPELDRVVAEFSRRLGTPTPSVRFIEDDAPIIVTSGTKAPEIIVSSGLLGLLDLRQMRAALAHEVAHIFRRSNALTLVIFFVRLVMFYNPVTLLVFRRMIQDDEHICDDITVALTGEPEAFASALKVFHFEAVPPALKISALKESIETQSHNVLLRDRIVRLESQRALKPQLFDPVAYLVTMIAVVVVSFFVV